tara:strand:- start:161 stop:742 length:582 start_codon:yes stop_codon:yes gene_type:complete
MTMQITKEILQELIKEEVDNSLEEKRKRSRKRTKKRKKSKVKKRKSSKVKKRKSSGKKDACYYKVKSRYSVWPSAYASGALVRCRKVGAKNWGNKSKKNENLQEELVSSEIQALHSKMKDRYEELKAKKEKSREEERNELRMKKALDDPGLKQALADDRKRQSLLDLFNFNLDEIISEVIDEVLAEKKNLKNG